MTVSRQESQQSKKSRQSRTVSIVESKNVLLSPAKSKEPEVRKEDLFDNKPLSMLSEPALNSSKVKYMTYQPMPVYFLSSF
jgi:hypothetical protein